MLMQQQKTESRWTIFFTGTVITFGVLMFCAGAGLLWMVNCGGDGGDPYAAPASPMAQACQQRSIGGRWTIEGMALVSAGAISLIGLLAAVVARRILIIAAAGILSASLIVAVVAIPLALESQCTEEQWSELSARQCRTYSRSGP